MGISDYGDSIHDIREKKEREKQMSMGDAAVKSGGIHDRNCAAVLFDDNDCSCSVYQGSVLTVDTGPARFDVRATALMAAANCSGSNWATVDIIERAQEFEGFLKEVL